MVPLWAADGGAGPGAAGTTTGVFMAATVAAQLAVPALLRRVGHRASLVLGALALGIPAAVLPASGALPVLLAVAVVRGVGFGVVTVAGAALVADLAPAALRGRAAGAYGAAVGLPQLVLLTGGVWAYTVLGPTVVLLAGAALPLVAVPAARLLPARVPARVRAAGSGGTRLWRRGWGPWLVMLVCAAGAGGVITVLPLAAAGPGAGSSGSAAAALFALTAGQLVGRSVAGEVVDRWSRPGRATPVGLALTAAGAAVVAAGVGHGPVGMVLGAALVGVGFGAVQNDTLVTLFARAGPDRSGPASTLWNTAYDSGTGLGASVLAGVLGVAGAATAFVVAAAACVLVLPASLVRVGGSGRDRRAPGAGSGISPGIGSG